MLIIFVILVSNNPALCFWPPPYKVDLNYEQTFVIDEHLEKKDVQDVYDEDELLKKEDMRSLNIEPEDDKYFRIDQEIKKSDKNTKEQRLSDEDNFKKHKVYEEENPDIEELVPWQAGFVDKSGEINNSREMIYFDEEARQKINKTKREKSPTKDDYDYSQFKAEYSKNVEMEQKSNNTANYTEVKEEESFKDAVKTLVKNAPGNCSEQENKGIGISALGCIIIDLQKPKMRSRSLEKFIRIVIIWTVVYLVIAVPLWCQYGWCCCCCRCKFCKPREEIDEIKKFFAQNPAGVYHDPQGNKTEYHPTHYEKYTQKKLDKALQRL